TGKNSSDLKRRLSKLPNQRISQDSSLLLDSDLLYSTFFIEHQHRVLVRSGQHVDDCRVWMIDHLFRDSLAFNNLDSQTSLRIYKHRVPVAWIERIDCDGHAGAVGVDALLNQHRRINSKVIHAEALSSLVSFVIPDRCPNSLYGLQQLFI